MTDRHSRPKLVGKISDFLPKTAPKSKIFKDYAGIMQCVWCKKTGHLAYFCPSRQTIPQEEIPYVTELLRSPTIDVQSYASLTLEQAHERLKTLGENFNKSNPWADSTDPAHAIKAKLGYWKALGTDPVVLSWLAYGVELTFERTPPATDFVNHPSYFEHLAFVNEQINDMVARGDAVEVNEDECIMIEPLQVLADPAGIKKTKLCTDKRFSNSFQAKAPFTMETLEKDIQMVLDGDTGTKLFVVDLKRAFYSIPLSRQSRPYSSFRHNGKTYQNTTLLYGFCTAPFWFGKTMRAVVRLIRALNIPCMQYADDFLFAIKLTRAHDGIPAFVKALFSLLGLPLSEKTCWEPADEVQYLGYIINSKEGWIGVPEEKRLKLLHSILQLLSDVHSAQGAAVKQLHSTTASIIALKLALQNAMLFTRVALATVAHCKRIERDTIRTSTGSELSDELQYWLHILRDPLKCKRAIFQARTDIELRLDAGEFAVGGHVLNLDVTIPLPTEFIGTSSTHRELWAATVVPLHFKHILSNRNTVLTIFDSANAVIDLQKGGSRKCPHLTQLCKVIDDVYTQQLNIQNKLWGWVERKHNTRADANSKALTAGLTSLTVHPDIIKAITHRWHMTIGDVWAPNFGQIGQSILLALKERKRVAFVIPKWQGRPWWPQVLEHARDSFSLPPAAYTLAPTWHTHPLHIHRPQWHMLAALFDFAN